VCIYPVTLLSSVVDVMCEIVCVRDRYRERARDSVCVSICVNILLSLVANVMYLIHIPFAQVCVCVCVCAYAHAYISSAPRRGALLFESEQIRGRAP